ncbi:hypothetical protein GOBAR_AA16556 [Gossypium barbadense]|uniref:Protein kinase domain-containing protein n=2 Tax=Gossypium TaxID=3633 RepID=A0A2P5XL79_GOSBA|nr:hypothetical protein GOBAR_AA16556 [Gossypium barbadense]
MAYRTGNIARSRRFWCSETCGTVSIPYPFGIKRGCYAYNNSWFRVTCNETADGPKPFITRINLELLGKFWRDNKVVTINNPVTYLNCGDKGNNSTISPSSVNLQGTPFFFSNQHNTFGSIGCGNLATSFRNNQIDPIASCVQHSCGDPSLGFGGCYALISEQLTSYTTSIAEVKNPAGSKRCASAFVFDSSKLPSWKISINTTHVPAILEWNPCDLEAALCFDVDKSVALPYKRDDCSRSCGCGSLATFLRSPKDNYPARGCQQPYCDDSVTSNATCSIDIPTDLRSFAVNMKEINPSHSGRRSCGSAFVVDQRYLEIINSDQNDTSNWKLTHVPTTLRWATLKRGICNCSSNNLSSINNEYCWKNLGQSYLCVCTKEDETNFSTDICQDQPYTCTYYRYCYMLCLDAPGNKCSSSSSCPDGYQYSGVMCCSTSLGTLFALLGTWHLYKVLDRRKKFKLKQKYFRRNGGLLLQQQLSRNEGGQGTVYKGMLADGSVVAVKKSKLMEEKIIDKTKLEQFINEVMILSQINHRNVVKLLGCCLETKVPLLVYEFIPNGTLYHFINQPNEEFPLIWKMRLRIAIEIANALSYLHPAASIPIYHRDIKSSNILLDDKYRAKVSDFGISRSVALEQTHVTTRVQGTFGYLDPEYFRSSKFTEKSDVYSFGVVLVELITGQKPISSSESKKVVRSLANFFLLSMKENSLLSVVDPMVMNGNAKEEIVAVAKLAKRCLNFKGKKRPTMKQVAVELEWIRSSEEANAIQQSADEDSNTDEMTEALGVASFSTSCSVLKDTVTVFIDT